MTERVFVIMQIGAKGSPERKRADEIYNFIISPSILDVGLEPYRADQDLTPGAITPKFLSELLNARLVIADLTGRNPNVYYELGIVHSFARPLISIADTSGALPFDTKDERIIELGEYPSAGLTYSQGEQAKVSLQESLKIVLSDNYRPPSPLREVAANASVDRLAPENPIAAEMAQIREALEEIRRQVVPVNLYQDLVTELIEMNRSYHDLGDFMRSLRSIPTNALVDERTPARSKLNFGDGHKSLSQLNFADLQSLARQLRIPGTERMRKGELIAEIEKSVVRGEQPGQQG